MKYFNHYLPVAILFSLLVLSGCTDDDVPEEVNEEEIVTDIILSFTPEGGGSVITATAKDPDGQGPKDIEIVTDIVLAADTQYTLTIALENSVAGESITEEIEEEADEHMFFFAWTEGFFTSPEGDGNIDNREGKVNYQDFDENSLPVGLETTWTTGVTVSSNGTFRIVLKHQPDIKSATSTVNDGESDVDLTWGLSVQ